MTLNEIADKIIEQEPQLDKTDFKTTLSAVLSMEMKKKDQNSIRLIRKSNSEGKWTYKAK